MTSARFTKINRQSRWLVAILEGLGAGLFLAVLFRDSINESGPPGYFRSVVGALVITALVAFALWPMTAKNGRFPLDRAAVFGILVVLIASYFWVFMMALLVPGASYMRSFPYLPLVFADVWEMGRFLINLLGGAAIGAVLFGWLTFPIGIGIAWTVAVTGNRRLDKFGAAATLEKAPGPGSGT